LQARALVARAIFRFQRLHEWLAQGKGTSLLQSNVSLTDNEGTLLALVARAEPITAYQIAKVYEESPVSNFNTSKGKIYPMIRKLRSAGLLRAHTVPGDARGTEQLETTQQGRQAIRAWIMAIRPTHLLLEDPLRTKVQSFDLLSREERIEWLSELKVQLLRKLEDVERYGQEVSVPYQELVHANAVRSLRSRMDWLDLVLHRIVSEKDGS
jgi:DNA-binding PadR family transcriptional regulator